MKNIIIILISLISSQVIYAVQTCVDYIPNEWPNTRYIVQLILGDNVVIDKKTGLMWKQCSEGLFGTDCLIGTANTYTWQQALSIPAVINTSDFAGFSDWRIPNIKELRSIAATNCYNPAININVFPNTPISTFWSSSPITFYTTDVWTVTFLRGYDDNHDRNRVGNIRLVRSIQ